MTFLIAFVITAAVILLWLMMTYNGLVKLKNLKDEAWSGISVQLKRRFDLVPNLVETVKGYAAHEAETLQAVTKARSAIQAAGDNPQEIIKAENALTGTLRSLFAVAESYPDLKANAGFIDLQQQLSRIEDSIQIARRYYNGTARNFNTFVQRFPTVLIARHLGFTEAEYFEVAEEETSVPRVSF